MNNDTARTTYDEIQQMVFRLEEEIAQKQQALGHLKAALNSFAHETPKPQPLTAVSAAPSKDNSPQFAIIIDKFIENPNTDFFTIDTVADELEKAGIYPTQQVRRRISAALGRRVSEKRILKLQRGMFRVAVQATQNDTNAPSGPEDPQSVLG